ncbi:MAG: glycosyl hydrolase family 18 protein [Clostridiales bacterium]|nr:glycosyl hydrolase family 18 protein [Clostridiales bacterium]
MKKVIPVIVAIVLIIVVAGIGVGARLLEKYSYSKEYADLTEYFGITAEEDVAVILQDEQIEEYAKVWDGVCYFDLATVHKYFNDRFYEDKKEGLLLYTLPDTVISTLIGSTSVSVGGEESGRDYVIARYEGETLYIAADFVREYTNFSYDLYTEPNHMQVYTEWEERQTATVSRDTQVRYQGGIKSDILTNVSQGDQVIVLEQMETWSKVKTQDAYIGYVENKRLGELTTQQPVPVTDYEEPVYESNTRDYKINMAWHGVSGVAGNDTLEALMENTKSVNVISPTWFTLSDNEGNFTSFASQDYVDKAHAMGLEVWALVGNVESQDVSMYEVLAGTSVRTHLIDGLIEAALQYDLDGINIDFENIGLDAGEPFIEFIRELSIPCREYGIVLSVDNYVPMAHTDYYDREEQGIVADYVVIMGYDEHYKGSEEAGSVASIDFVEQGIANTVAQVPAEKVINAIPFYTRIWETTGTTVDSQAVGMEMAQQYLEDHGITTRWDETTCQNYGEYQSGDSYYQIWLEDEESIRVKLNIMEKYEIAGVAEWKLGFETASVWDVIEEYMKQ